MFLFQNLVLFSQNSCAILKKAFDNSKSIEDGNKYKNCLLESEDTLGYDYGRINQKIGLLYFKEKQFEKGLYYSFVAKNIFDNLYRKNKLIDKEEKKQMIYLYSNIRKALDKSKTNIKGEKFVHDYVNLYLDDYDLIKNYSKDPKNDLLRLLYLYSKYYVYESGKLVNKKSLYKTLKKISQNKDNFLHKNDQNIYQKIGYHLRTINKNPIDWETVEYLYKKNLEEAEKSKNDSLILEAHDAIPICYIYKLNDEKKTKNKDVERVAEAYKYIIDYLKKRDNSDKLNSSYETLGKYYYLSARYYESNQNDDYRTSYYDSTSKYWDKAASGVKNNLGIFNPKYSELISCLNIVYKKSGKFEKQKECNRILLNIKNQIKDPLEYQIVSISSSEDGSVIVAGTDDGKVKIWNRFSNINDSERLISKDHILGFKIEKVKVNNDGFFISTCDNELKLWDRYGNFLDTTTSFNKNEIEFSSKNKCLKLSENQYVSYESGKFKKSNKEFFRTPQESYYSTNTFDGSIEFIHDDNNINTIKNSTSISVSCAADKQPPLAIGADLNGSIFIWERNSSNNFQKIDSLDLRRKPALYFISISSDSSNMLLSKKCFNKLKNEVFKNDYFDIDHIDSRYFYDSSLTSKQLFDYHDSLKKNSYQNDFIIYDFSGFSNDEEIQLLGSEKMELENFYSISEKVNSTEKLFFIDTDNNFSALLKEIMVNQLRDNENLKENKIIISESNGRFLTESYLGTDASLLDLFRKDHKYRTECLHKLYDYTPKNRDYRLKSYFQSDDFDFESENNFSDNLNLETQKIYMGKTVVILVANNTYSSNKIKSLGENPINDINRIEKKLNSKFNIDEKHIFRIVNKTKSEFLDTISEIFKKFNFERGSQLLFYFAGHGTNNNDVSKLLFKDADIKGTRGEITFEVLVKTINSNFNKGLTKSLIILDACQQGQDDNMIFKKQDGINLEIDNYYDSRQFRAFVIQKASIVISSTSTNQLASNGKRGGNSPFCEAFIYALDNGSKMFTNHELFKNISQNYSGYKTTLKHIDMGYKNNQSENPRFFFIEK